MLLNAGEMQWIADNLFVGNKLAQGAHRHLRRRAHRPAQHHVARSSCSAPGATRSRRRRRRWAGCSTSTTATTTSSRSGQTIVYSVHQTIGHLGIFVSGKVATKEHSEFASCIDMIDMLPPGLYEAVITEVEDGHGAAGPHRRASTCSACEPRTLDDIRALGRNDAGGRPPLPHGRARLRDQQGSLRDLRRAGRARCCDRRDRRRRCATRTRIACASRRFSDQNPSAGVAEDRRLTTVRENRVVAADDNPFRVAEGQMAQAIGQAWTHLGRLARRHAGTGLPVDLRLAAAAGHGRPARRPRRERAAGLARRLARSRGQGSKKAAGARHRPAAASSTPCCARSLYVVEPGAGVDERGFATLKPIGAELPASACRSGQDAFKAALRKQFLTLRMDRAKAIEALPALLP